MVDIRIRLGEGEMETGNEMERYLDFSQDGRDVQAFGVGTGIHPMLEHYAKEIQGYLSERNPICGIRGLIALDAAAYAGFSIGAKRSRAITNALLGVIALTLMYIAYQLS